MEDSNFQLEEEHYEMSWPEINLVIIVFSLLIIIYLLFSYGEYIECVKTIELSIELYKDTELSWKLFGIVDEFEECKFPLRLNTN